MQVTRQKKTTTGDTPQSGRSTISHSFPPTPPLLSSFAQFTADFRHGPQESLMLSAPIVLIVCASCLYHLPHKCTLEARGQHGWPRTPLPAPLASCLLLTSLHRAHRLPRRGYVPASAITWNFTIQPVWKSTVYRLRFVIGTRSFTFAHIVLDRWSSLITQVKITSYRRRRFARSTRVKLLENKDNFSKSKALTYSGRILKESRCTTAVFIRGRNS